MERSGLRRAFTPLATTFSASMSRPESVSSRMASFGSSTAICKISLRFFSPPEKPSFTERFMSFSSISSSLSFSRNMGKKSMASISSRPRYLRIAFRAERKKYTFVMPGISTGY